MRPDELPGKLAAIAEQGLIRRRRLVAAESGARVLVQGRALVNFSSNDYLGLSRHPDVIAAMAQGAREHGAGSGASHLVCGHSTAHHALEEELADFTGRERALLFSTGYMANMGVIASLCGRNERVYQDRLNHASLLDGAALAGARLIRYAHADAGDLRHRLAQDEAPGSLVVTDGVFSMDGDIAPLPDLAEAAAAAGAWLVVDDAHGFGVLGTGGRGSVSHHGLGQAAVPVLIGTLGKAFGTFGAFVAGSADLIEYLIQKSRTYIYTTALPPAVAEATRVSLRLLRDESWRRQRLGELIARFRAGAMQLGLHLMDSPTPIQPILLGDNDAALRAAEYLRDRGCLVSAIRPPTVPAGSARLRVTLTADHEPEQVDALLQALREFA
ncbi:8-amino-7-oxononanoate synthase [Methyloterricola oryzae]|uniref:8-amino-7-oxononanoate synthase n=1 Tax=Methyloterricola oryzae TaxID=1495050 RepID=UPI0005EB5000|nr:8-amino-7-oxononanoate synthase [Methyloterricola oryzae]